eukprot:CAMPEP_0172590986 /NCGR_PEP_ID=MMETSP1068-20121228/9692_1 /TAXON_ID=35684 /ORGANISM="Pseudopedinella elastica, Strain CCMP716" /LENGTH=461 /DNA_ID=CAMNT_0013387199 /DNA_START=99 /DNA_END=1484 /DNA_ORIENTATION=-
MLIFARAAALARTAPAAASRHRFDPSPSPGGRVTARRTCSRLRAATSVSSPSMYSAELELAREVVLHASAAARALQGRALVVQKDDESAISSGGYDPLQDGANPVTVADFTVQCLVLSALHEAFPGDRFIAEETSAQLLASGEATVAATLAAVRAAAAEASPAAGPAAGGSEGPHLGFEGLETLEGVCAALDLGATGLSEGWSKAHRTWVLDPIDGTKGFVRGDQFAVALALLDQGSPVLGILGCPNLAPPDEAAAQGREPGAAANKRRGAERPTGCVKDDDEAGSLFWAVKGHGAYLENLGVGGEASPRGGARRISVGQQRSYRSVVRLEAFEAAHSNFGAAQAVARALDLGGDREPVRMDGQGKYGLIACGAGADLPCVLLRLPRPGYVECIWDHAAGGVIVAEAGGRATDLEGRPLNFSEMADDSGGGAKLSPGVRGVVVSSGDKLHADVLEALRRDL